MTEIESKPKWPSRPDRLMLYSLAYSWDLPGWFDDLGASPSKSELDAWRWAFRAHGSRSLSAAQKDVLWTVFTYAQAKDSDRGPVGMAWPAQATIASAAMVTETTVGNALKVAEEAGWLIRKRVPNTSSRIYFSLPLTLPAVTVRRSSRVVPTENRTPVPTENHQLPDGEPDPRPDGEEPTEELTPTDESTPDEGFGSLASPAQAVAQATKKMYPDQKVCVRLQPSGQQLHVDASTAEKMITEGKAVSA